MKNELKRYIKEINKGLHLPHKMKKRITTELLSEIYGRIDDGEELNSVLTSIGTPQELVEELVAYKPPPLFLAVHLLIVPPLMVTVELSAYKPPPLFSAVHPLIVPLLMVMVD